MQKGFVPILIVLLIAILGVGEYFAYTNYSNSQSKTLTQNQVDETANWKTYTMLNSPLAFKYPEYLTLAEDYFTFDGVYLTSPKGCKVSTECHIIMQIQALKNTKGYPVDEYYMIAGDADVFKDIPHQEATIAGLKAYKYQTPNDQDVVTIFGNKDWIFIVKDDDNLLVGMKVLDPILSTFKFTQ